MPFIFIEDVPGETGYYVNEKFFKPLVVDKDNSDEDDS